jgi:hypothetical protein
MHMNIQQCVKDTVDVHCAYVLHRQLSLTISKNVLMAVSQRLSSILYGASNTHDIPQIMRINNAYCTASILILMQHNVAT